MKSAWLVVVVCLLCSVTAYADDLYDVRVTSETDAVLLQSHGLRPLLRISEGYLILIDPAAARTLAAEGIDMTLVASDVRHEELMLDRRPDRANADRYPLIFEQGGLRVFRLDMGKRVQLAQQDLLSPIPESPGAIRYFPPKAATYSLAETAVSLDSIVSLVSQDSVQAYLERLQAFHRRLVGTDSNYAARDWIYNKLQSFSLDEVLLYPFTGEQLWSYNEVPCYNVLGYKTGTVEPEKFVIVGGHFDGVPDCPAADDNGSGTVGVLEIARALSQVETDMTIIYIAFDSEESGLWGSWTYAWDAAYRGDDIVVMYNMDMIGHLTNNSWATLYAGPERGFADLWGDLAPSLVGISMYYGGMSYSSDHYPFLEAGYDVAFVQEGDFSPHWHEPTDSTQYVNYDYLTRMIQATAATAYFAACSPAPIAITAIRDVGDGQSLRAWWEASSDPTLDHYVLFWDTSPASGLDSMILPAGTTTADITGLTTGTYYQVYAAAVDADGFRSVTAPKAYGTPYLLPALPEELRVLPVTAGISLMWFDNNNELDFDHYEIIRDDTRLPDIITSTWFLDDDPGLGSDIHDYWVVAVDLDDNISDTTGVPPQQMRAATLSPGRVLAVNRSSEYAGHYVDEQATGQFLRDALAGYDFDYLSDTAYWNGDSLQKCHLMDLVAYEAIILAGESVRVEPFGEHPPFISGKLDSIAYYMNLGGKVVMFGRWGDFAVNPGTSTIEYGPGSFNPVYTSYFNVDSRLQLLSVWSSGSLTSDMIGAYSLVPEYPHRFGIPRRQPPIPCRWALSAAYPSRAARNRPGRTSS